MSFLTVNNDSYLWLLSVSDKKTEYFIYQIKVLRLEIEDIMISFDFTSQFTTEPTQLTLTIVLNRPSTDVIVQERTNL